MCSIKETQLQMKLRKQIYEKTAKSFKYEF
jgi:hypothetical protein